MRAVAATSHVPQLSSVRQINIGNAENLHWTPTTTTTTISLTGFAAFAAHREPVSDHLGVAPCASGSRARCTTAPTPPANGFAASADLGAAAPSTRTNSDR